MPQIIVCNTDVHLNVHHLDNTVMIKIISISPFILY